MAAPKLNVNDTHADSLAWPDDQRWEPILGEAFAMGAAPQTRHQFPPFATKPDSAEGRVRDARRAYVPAN